MSFSGNLAPVTTNRTGENGCDSIYRLWLRNSWCPASIVMLHWKIVGGLVRSKWTTPLTLRCKHEHCVYGSRALIFDFSYWMRMIKCQALILSFLSFLSSMISSLLDGWRAPCWMGGGGWYRRLQSSLWLLWLGFVSVPCPWPGGQHACVLVVRLWLGGKVAR